MRSSIRLGWWLLPTKVLCPQQVNRVTSRRFIWDHRNRLIEVKDSTVNTIASYQYDAFNRLVYRYDSLGATTWGYDEGINPQLEATSQLGLTHRYLWSDQVDELLADEQRTGSSWNTLWALSDHQGTVKDLIDYNPAGAGTSTIANSRLYDAFGNLELQTGTATTPIGYTGKYYDQATGLQNSWNRWYSPKMGRFISQDPIGFAAGDANLYRYVGNDVTAGRDPSGLVEEYPWWHPNRYIKATFYYFAGHMTDAVENDFKGNKRRLDNLEHVGKGKLRASGNFDVSEGTAEGMATLAQTAVEWNAMGAEFASPMTTLGSRCATAGKAANFEIRGFRPNVSKWQKNSWRVGTRTEKEVLPLLKKHGVEIPDDVSIIIGEAEGYWSNGRRVG